ncbi:MAG: hypothetical protein JNL74_20685, partial [Fibrobacteres bacterium]|nr:hypothetical protein [Fibrobacterota bacterium]
MNLRALSLSFVLLISLSGFSLINVPLEAQNWTGDTRIGEPVTAGVPLPAGAISDLSKLRIVDGSGNTVPAQFKPLARWWKERAKGIAVPSVKWVLCDFQATSIAGKNKADFFLRDDNTSTPASSSLSVTEDASAVTVTTGPLRFSLSKLRFNLFDEVWINGNKVVSSSLQNGGFV